MNRRWRMGDVGYCTNVHPINTLDDISHAIKLCLSNVRRKLQLPEIGAGLWIPNSVLEALMQSGQSREIRKDLNQEGVDKVTLNGFPYGDFHSAKVKKQVYVPDWSQQDRLNYTVNLSHQFVELMGDSQPRGTISTLPLGYRSDWNSEAEAQAKLNLCKLSDELAILKEKTGKSIVVCLEMEPDCVLESTIELLSFYQELLLAARLHGVSEANIYEHIGICFDVCHQAVMHEDIKHSLSVIHQMGITIGKVQISNALRIPQGSLLSDVDLSCLVDEKYLHQMKGVKQGVIVETEGDLSKESIPRLLHSDKEWRIHYHVPVHLESFRLENIELQTTQQCILDTFDFLSDCLDVCPDIEVETYTLPVILAAQKKTDYSQALIDTLVKELAWVRESMRVRNLLID